MLGYGALPIGVLLPTFQKNVLPHFQRPGSSGRLEYSRILLADGNRGSTVVKELCYKSEGRWFDPKKNPSWCQWIFH